MIKELLIKGLIIVASIAIMLLALCVIVLLHGYKFWLKVGRSLRRNSFEAS